MGPDFIFRQLRVIKSDSHGFPVSVLSDFSVEVSGNKSVAILKNGKFCNAFQVGDKVRHPIHLYPAVSCIGTLIGVTAQIVTIAALGDDGNICTHHLPMAKFCQLNENFDHVSLKNLKNLKGFESL